MKVMKNKFYRCINEFEFDPEHESFTIKPGEKVFVIDLDDTGVFVNYDYRHLFIGINTFNSHFEQVEEKTEKKSEENFLTDSQIKIETVLDAMKDLLIYKNQKYGDSALKPKNVFFKGDATNSILIRLDDKLGRIMNNKGNPRTNDVCDLIGYLTLLLVSMGVSKSDIEKLKD